MIEPKPKPPTAQPAPNYENPKPLEPIRPSPMVGQPR
jgi:hypothetical protein